jgi:hypothetical protein
VRLGDAMCDLHYAQEDEERDFLGLASKSRSMGFSRFGLKTAGFEFLGLGLKTGSYGFVIWLSKSPRQFLNLGLKTKWATVCRFCHKTNGRMKTTCDRR